MDPRIDVDSWFTTNVFHISDHFSFSADCKFEQSASHIENNETSITQFSNVNWMGIVRSEDNAPHIFVLNLDEISAWNFVFMVRFLANLWKRPNVKDNNHNINKISRISTNGTFNSWLSFHFRIPSFHDVIIRCVVSFLLNMHFVWIYFNVSFWRYSAILKHKHFTLLQWF